MGIDRDLHSLKGAQIKIASAPSSKHKADCALIPHTIKETKAIHILGSSVALPLATFLDGRFVQLSIVSPDHLDEVPCTICLSQWVAADATSVNQVRLLKSIWIVKGTILTTFAFPALSNNLAFRGWLGISGCP